MALATNCPHCNARFRIGAEQLRSHNGMVRCGSCRQVFNAIGRLDYIEATEPAAGAPAAPTASAGAAAHSAAAAPAAPVATAAPVAAPASPAPARAPAPPTPVPVSARVPAPVPVAVAAARSAAPAAAPARPAARPAAPAEVASAPAAATRASAPAPAPAAAPESGEAARIERRRDAARLARQRAAEAEAREILRGAAHGEVEDDSSPNTMFDRIYDDPEATEGDEAQAADQPTFLRETPPAQRRARRTLLGVACLLLAPLFVLQLALLLRADLVARIPELRPALQALCDPFGCSAAWPMRPEYLAVVSSELQAVPGTSALELDAVIRNRADFPMALPAIELTLTDTFNHTVGRKVFRAEDYLAYAAPEARGDHLSGGADLSVRLLFALPGANVAGFVAYPFYP
jgi:predicted Zn finger-like uncharacterized protein